MAYNISLRDDPPVCKECAALRQERDHATVRADTNYASYKMASEERDIATADAEERLMELKSVYQHHTDVEAERDNWQALAAAADADKRKAQSEMDFLRHDIARHVAITSEQAGEIEMLRALLKEVRHYERIDVLTASRIDAALSREGK